MELDGSKARGLTSIFSGNTKYCCHVPDGHGIATTLWPSLKAPELVTILPTPWDTQGIMLGYMHIRCSGLVYLGNDSRSFFPGRLM